MNNLQTSTARVDTRRTIYIFERGILGWQSIFGDWKNWPNQACVWVNKYTSAKSATITYFTGPILAGLTRGRRAKNFAQLIRQYAGWKIVMVGHSEGTATGLRALRYAGWPRVDEVHLVCGACDSDYRANGLNDALASGKVGRVYVYIAEKDFAMKLEDNYAGCFFFGLQTAGQPMGLKGPTHMTPAAERRTKIISWEDYGHSTCWECDPHGPNHFQETMKQILSPETYEPKNQADTRAHFHA